MAAVRIGSLWGYIDTWGKVIIAPRFEDALEFSGGLAAVMVGEKVGFIDAKGEMVIEPQFDMTGSFQKD